MKVSDHLKREREYVESTLPANVAICPRVGCLATLATYAQDCTADISDACPGFLAIERAKGEFKIKAAAQ